MALFTLLVAIMSVIATILCCHLILKEARKGNLRSHFKVVDDKWDFGHPLWTPPMRCSTDQLPTTTRADGLYPGSFYCPPVRVPYLKKHVEDLTKFSLIHKPAPEDFWMLDAPAILSQIATKVSVSKWLVNVGARPVCLAEDGERRLTTGDDTTVLWHMGYSGVNFECGDFMSEYYEQWPKAQYNSDCSPPPDFPMQLRKHGVPHAFDFLKIDIDSYDCVFLTAALEAGYKPLVINIETQPAMPPPLKFMLHYSKNIPLERKGPFWGCSLQMVVEILQPWGYELVQYVVEDAWFVQKRFADMFKFGRNASAEYFMGNPNLFGIDRWGSFELGKELVELHDKPEAMLRRAKAIEADIVSTWSKKNPDLAVAANRAEETFYDLAVAVNRARAVNRA